MFLGKYKNLYDFLIDFARLVHFPLLPFSRFLLHCNLITIFTSICSTLCVDLQSVDVNTVNFLDNEIVQLLLHSSPKIASNQNEL